MSSVYTLQKNAVTAAKHLNWDGAIKINQEILEIDPENINALNRLGVAQMQTKQLKKAHKTFLSVLSIQKINTIAKKNIQKIKQKQIAIISTFTNNFIEEPGKSKTIQLCRLTNKKHLQNINPGQQCSLVIKNRYVSIKMDDQYVGSLPEDISFRLSKLINSGNTYSCTVKSCDEKKCMVHISEQKISKKNTNIPSFSIAHPKCSE